MFDVTVLTEMTAKIAGLDEHLYADDDLLAGVKAIETAVQYLHAAQGAVLGELERPGHHRRGVGASHCELVGPRNRHRPRGCQSPGAVGGGVAVGSARDRPGRTWRAVVFGSGEGDGQRDQRPDRHRVPGDGRRH
ncbi:MAG: hypothetical protein V9G12_15540 [Microthrixaceae bacterium]